MGGELNTQWTQGLVLDHVAIATADLDSGSQPYLAMGLKPLEEDEVVESQGVKVRIFEVGSVMIELLSPTRPDSPIQTFLEKKGSGLHHMAFRVPDLQQKIEELQAQEARFIGDAPRPGRAGSRVIFLHPKWGQGALIELVEHP
ncbi:methylmalonyl-CoA epimerase [Deinococcus cellulosilyticus]|uniref:Methylmalonyl-CoA epimerase n=1 Tax=Deinococcus cellulosilyticus (strain DSM 18568 / NBRC 106333 / KACC 11606 / 5516J-15) TaxID=1223518 RepID=A0A511NAT1_DEIC1|nr:methylmalonyl-CoA epimerase [Deinococcus cellulosilyticus]GEM49920.1 methylmalonyl-CoA epimerase [Deinococcus cellulosilyticus NBRC 106333 = KACC 11606]